MLADSTLQLPIVAAGSLTGDLHKYLCSCNLSEDYGQESRRVRFLSVAE